MLKDARAILKQANPHVSGLSCGKKGGFDGITFPFLQSLASRDYFISGSATRYLG